MLFKLEISTFKEQFQSSDARKEIARVLRRVADDMEKGGNGWVSLEEEQPISTTVDIREGDSSIGRATLERYK